MFRSLLSLILFVFLTNFSFNPVKVIYSFKTQKDNHIIKKPIKTFIIGKVISIKIAERIEIQKYEEFATEFSNQVEVVTIKVLNENYKPRLGDSIYLVEDKLSENTNDALILSELKIHSISKTAFHGVQIRALGYLSLIQKQPLVALAPILDGRKENSILARNRGDFWMYRKNYSKALQFYKKAIELDSYPLENYLKLAKVYQETQVNYLSIYYNLEKVWNRRKFFSHKQEELNFYQMYSSFLIQKFENEKSYANLKDLKKSVLVSEEGLNLFVDNFDLHFSLNKAIYLILKNTEKEKLQYESLFNKSFNRMSQKKENYLKHQFYESSILFHFYLSEKQDKTISEKRVLIQKIEKEIEQYLVLIPKDTKIDSKILGIKEKIGLLKGQLEFSYEL